MIILSLDLSLKCTGFAIFDTNKRSNEKKLLTYGHISNEHLSSDEIGIKLNHFELAIKSLLVGYRPNVIVVEELTGTRFNDLKQNAKVHGILEKLTIGRNVVYINNKTFKKSFTNNGNAKKEQVANKVLEYIPNLHFYSDDESDAIGLGIDYAIKLKEW